MTEVTGDLWEYAATHNIVVPTNMAGPMGRGVAKQAVNRYGRAIQNEYRIFLRKWPSKVENWTLLPGWRDLLTGESVLFLPVKDHWADQADLKIIDHCVGLLRDECLAGTKVAMPMIGCGFGELRQSDVMPILKARLGDLPDVVLVTADKDAVARRYAATLKPGARRDARFS